MQETPNHDHSNHALPASDATRAQLQSTQAQTATPIATPILSLPNINKSHSSNGHGHGHEHDTVVTTALARPLRKKRKISLRVPKCKPGDEMECVYVDEDVDQDVDHADDDDDDDGGEWRLCTVIAIKANSNKEESASAFLYYVHFTDYNKRLDRWVSGHFLRRPTGKVKKPSEVLLANTNNKRLTRGQKRAVFEEHHIDMEEFESGHGGDPDTLDTHTEDDLYEKIHLSTNKIKNIEKIQFGARTIIDCWYFSPYPEEYIGSTQLLYICEYCLKYMKYYNTFVNHVQNECMLRHPPGNEIYRYNGLSVFEMDGCVDKIYCQNLCLLAKLFFDHKTLYFDVSPFLFYVVCEYDENPATADGFHLVGYFSKEKNSPEQYNLACILTMPHKQKQGFGRFIIDLSYELSRKQNKIGSPEKPLSDLGKISYRSFWIENILKVLAAHYGEVNIEQISKLTCFTKQDIVASLKEVNMLNNYKGQYVIKYREDSVRKYLEEFKKREKKRKNIFYPEHLQWTFNVVSPKNHPWNGLSSFHK